MFYKLNVSVRVLIILFKKKPEAAGGLILLAHVGASSTDDRARVVNDNSASSSWQAGIDLHALAAVCKRCDDCVCICACVHSRASMHSADLGMTDPRVILTESGQKDSRPSV